MPKRTRVRRPKRKTRKGGFLGFRSTKTWDNNFVNCMKQNKNYYECRNSMLKNDYHRPGSSPAVNQWTHDNMKLVPKMWEPVGDGKYRLKENSKIDFKGDDGVTDTIDLNKLSGDPKFPRTEDMI